MKTENNRFTLISADLSQPEEKRYGISSVSIMFCPRICEKASKKEHNRTISEKGITN